MPVPTARRTAVATLCAATVLLAGLGAGSAAPALGAAAPTRIDPAKLARGADPTVPHVDGTTVVDGTRRVTVDADRVALLGRAGSDDVVAAYDADGAARVLRIGSTGAVSPVLTPARNGDEVVLSTDGSRLAQTSYTRRFTGTRVTVWSSTDGSVLTRRTFPGIQSVLDLDGRRVVLGDEDRTRVWRTGSSGGPGAVSLLAQRGGYRADLSSDRLATLTGDPYQGGCSVVSRLSDPTRVLWRSCAERVETFSPGGRRMATVDLLSDGLGPSQLMVRSATGKERGVYRVRGYLGALTWESARTLLVEAYGRTRGALVRCTGTTCERAGDLVDTPVDFADGDRPAGGGLPAAFGTR